MKRSPLFLTIHGPFGSSADKVFGSLARHPYVGGGFVWSGFDYLGSLPPTTAPAARNWEGRTSGRRSTG